MTQEIEQLNQNNEQLMQENENLKKQIEDLKLENKNKEETIMKMSARAMASDEFTNLVLKELIDAKTNVHFLNAKLTNY